MKSLKSSIPPKKQNYEDYLVNYKLFYTNIYNLDSMLNMNLDFIKSKIRDAALTSSHNYNANLPLKDS